jgi:hypothetical protein
MQPEDAGTQADRKVVVPEPTVPVGPEIISTDPSAVPERPPHFAREEAKRVFRAIGRLFEKQREI